jgi:hypothetical protein
MKLTQTLITKLIEYDPNTGVVTRIGRIVRGDRIKKHHYIPTARSTHGYLQMTICDKTYDIHRLIFLLIDGQFPTDDVDHIDGNRINNKWVNLRKVSRGVNLHNLGVKSNNTSGVTGVGLHKTTGKFRASICSHGVQEHLGVFNTIEEATRVRHAAEIRLGFSVDHGVRPAW